MSNEDNKLYLGIDVGSVTVKVVVLNEEEELLQGYYERAHGAPLVTVTKILDDLFQFLEPKRVVSLGTAGSGGELFAKLLGGIHTNELVAQTRAISKYHPEARTVIEIGGQDSKLLLLEQKGPELVLIDFSLNTQCAAGTGSFLDQQAARLGMPIEEFAQIALLSKKPPYIAGRCAVFAKSDIIHLQQVGTPLPDIVAGLCLALARNFRSDIGRGKEFRKPIVFQGGVSKNIGMVRAFEQVLGLKEGELIIPKQQTLMAAIGTALIAKEAKAILFDWAEKRQRLMNARSEEKKFHRRLYLVEGICGNGGIAERTPSGKVDAYLGIDVGSISTKLVAIDREERMLGRVYLRTGSDPLAAVQEGLWILDQDTKGKLNIIGVGTTGSGRELIGHFVGADVIKNEITAQATAALAIDPEVDTVFEIGGQDSKYIRLKDGAVIDFALNKACAAGTGSFLEEQATMLGLSIEDFSDIAFSSEAPAFLGERCTVFMESDLIHHQQRGAVKRDLVAGLAYSIAINYLNRVVGGHKIGDKIFFQGGVAWNKAVLAAFRNLLGKDVIVPPHHDVTGAYGMALITKAHMEGRDKATKFHGFDLTKRKYKISHFTCKACSNVCEMKLVKFDDSPPLFYGSRCGKFDALESPSSLDGLGKILPDLFKEREKLLWDRDSTEISESQKALVSRKLEIKQLEGQLIYKPYNKLRGRVGMPRVFLFWDKFPFWSAFFRCLGYEVVLSPNTNPEIVKESVQGATAEACLPSKIVYGHVKELLRQELDYLFIPAMIDSDHPNTKTQTNYNCPLIQGMPYMLKGQFEGFAHYNVQVIQDDFHFYRQEKLLQELIQLGKRLGGTKRAVREAIRRAWNEQHRFEEEIKRSGRRALRLISEEHKGIVIISRSYNGGDRGINLNIPGKLRKLGAIPIPLDFLPLEEINPDKDYSFMQWNCGKRILAAAELIYKTPNLYGIYVSHFRCGPDSFIAHYVKEIMKGKPLLQIELDEHSAEVGVITRCEAFLDSLYAKREKIFMAEVA